MKKVSIIVPVYNVAPYVGHCLETLIAQTEKNIEILVINDGSRDDSLAVCREYEAKDERITVIDQPNAGVSVARNAGLARATGEWICFVDGDDSMDENGVERMLAALQGGEDVLLTDYYVDTDTRSWAESFFITGDRVFTAEDRVELMKNCFVKTEIANRAAVTAVGVPWAKLYRRSLLEEKAIRFDPALRKMQDALFNLEVLQVAQTVRFVGIPVYHYRQNNASICHRTDHTYEKTTAAILKAFAAFIKKHGYQKELVPVYRARQFMFAFEVVKFQYLLDDTGLSFTEKRNGTKKVMQKVPLTTRQIAAIRPYLGKAHRIALTLYRMRAYTLMYVMMSAYFSLKKRRMR